MNKLKVLVSSIIIVYLNVTFSHAEDCNKYDKLTKEYTKCASEKLKNKSSKKAIELKTIASKKINEGKIKFSNFNLKEKFLKFKNSKTHKEFSEK